MSRDPLLQRGDLARATLQVVLQELHETRARLRRDAAGHRRRQGIAYLCPSDRQYMDVRMMLDIAR
jgi:hypothetical protein